MADDPQGHGLEASPGNCQECDCEHDVIAYRGTSLCCRCLATRGILLTNLNEGVQARARSHTAQQDDLRARSSAAAATAIAAEQTRIDAKRRAAAASPRRQIDQARLLRRTRGVTSG